MKVEEFVQKADFPINWKEKDVQDYIAKYLQKQGYKVSLEVTLGRGRADIIAQKGTTQEIIEVKKFLTRDCIYQALGQATCYSGFLKTHFNQHKILLIGFAPKPFTQAYDDAQNTASYVKSLGHEVIFINEDEKWLPSNSSKKPRIHYYMNLFNLLSKFSFENLAIMAIAIMIVGYLIKTSITPNAHPKHPICKTCKQ